MAALLSCSLLLNFLPFSLPFLKERSSDENTYAPCIIETLSLLGSLMIGLESEALRQHVAQTVADFYLAESNEAKAEGIIILIRL